MLSGSKLPGISSFGMISNSDGGIYLFGGTGGIFNCGIEFGMRLDTDLDCDHDLPMLANASIFSIRTDLTKYFTQNPTLIFFV